MYSELFAKVMRESKYANKTTASTTRDSPEQERQARRKKRKSITEEARVPGRGEQGKGGLSVWGILRSSIMTKITCIRFVRPSVCLSASASVPLTQINRSCSRSHRPSLQAVVVAAGCGAGATPLSFSSVILSSPSFSPLVTVSSSGRARGSVSVVCVASSTSSG